MAETPRSPVVVPAALLPKRRQHAKRRILDTDAATSLRSKLFFFDENTRESFEEESDVLIIDDSPMKKVKIEPVSPTEMKQINNETSKRSMHGAGVDIKSHSKSKYINSKNLCQLDIGNDLYLVANNFQDKLWFHIRVYEKRLDNTTYPTKKGIVLDLEKLTKLLTWYVDDVDEAIKEYDDDNKDVDLHIHLGCNYYVSLKQGYPVVNIRRWFLPDNEEQIDA
ncbi:uncharacterized protein LOC110458416 [Mizuhopecten yessoensis]|uniref:uncharacterized protein LOC110458416 n=1 Tax=Mizuhopecten yessoensis TaxID=6573 RepID=UPI000B458257|nr:uncharacterized protein LOC110458416 [Mizuhopecten yessoensis]